MTEIKKRFHINKLSVRNILLLVLLLAVISIGRLMHIWTGSVNAAQAQTCWTAPSGGGGGDGGNGDCASSDCTSDCASCSDCASGGCGTGSCDSGNGDCGSGIA